MSQVKTVQFGRGIHPAYDGKDLTAKSPVKVAPVLERYFVPISQNIGAPPELIVEVGSEVKKGQLIAKAAPGLSCNLHSPTSGKIESLTMQKGPSGVPVQTIIIASDMQDSAIEPLPAIDWLNATPKEIIERIAEAGIVGMGGAAFPTAAKMILPPGCVIDTVVVNGAECEPYLTADHRIMLEETEKVLIGTAIIGRALNAKKLFIGVELNKPDAITALQSLAPKYGIEVLGLTVRYPQGSEKQLIYAATKRRVPAGGLPREVGVVVQNVGTMAAVAEAMIDGKPLYERIVTISGDAVKEPGNWKLRIGTTIEQALHLTSGVNKEPAKILFGGPMMGMAQKSLDTAVQKNTSGILLLGPNNVEQYESTGCLRCGRCVRVCPMQLLPSFIASASESEKFDIAQQQHAMDCIECGCCAYVCPAHRPLVQHIRRAKAEIRRLSQKK